MDTTEYKLLSDTNELSHTQEQLETQEETPTNKISTYLAKFFVLVAVIPDALLSFTLIELLTRSLGVARFLIAPFIGIGTYIALYRFLSPYVIQNLINAPILIKKWSNKLAALDYTRNDVFYFFLYLANVVLTLNFVYIFWGLKLEGIDSAADMAHYLSTTSTGAGKDISSFLEGLFSNSFLKWFITSFSFPTNSLTCFSIHHYLLVSIPSNIFNYFKIKFEDTETRKLRTMLTYALNNCIRTLSSLSEARLSRLYVLANKHKDEDCLTQVNIIRRFLTLDGNVKENKFSGDLLAPLAKFSLCSIIFLATYSLTGATEVAADALGFGNAFDNSSWLIVMSSAMRVTLTILWYLNSCTALGNIVNAIKDKSLGIRLDSNFRRTYFFTFGLFAGAASAVTNVHAMLIALDMNNINYSSTLGILYIISSAFAPAAADGVPVYKNKIENFNATAIQDDTIPLRKRQIFLLTKQLTAIKSGIAEKDPKEIKRPGMASSWLSSNTDPEASEHETSYHPLTSL